MQRFQIVTYNIENFLCVNVKVMMSYYVSHTHNLTPWYRFIFTKYLFISNFIKTFKTFTDSNQQHACCIQLLHPTR